MGFRTSPRATYMQLKNGKFALYQGKDTNGNATYKFEDVFDGHLTGIKQGIVRTATFNGQESTWEEHSFEFTDPVDGSIYSLNLRSNAYVTYDLINRLLNIAVIGFEPDSEFASYGFVASSLDAPLLTITPYESSAKGDAKAMTFISLKIGNDKIKGRYSKEEIDRIAPITNQQSPVLHNGTIVYNNGVMVMQDILVGGKPVPNRALRDKWIKDQTDLLIKKLQPHSVIAESLSDAAAVPF